jgi:hypothetical protein
MRTRKNMNCNTAKDLMAIAVHGSLQPDELSTLEAHLSHCPLCNLIYDRIKGLQMETQKKDSAPLPDWEKSWKKIEAQAFKPVKSRRQTHLTRWVYAAAALATVFVLGFVLGRQFLPFPNSQDIQTIQSLSPVQDYAELAGPLLVSFTNRSPVVQSEEMAAFEKRLVSQMLEETKLLKKLVSQHSNPALLTLLDDMEYILMSIHNLKPDDKESAEHLTQIIRNKGLSFKLMTLSAVKSEI